MREIIPLQACLFVRLVGQCHASFFNRVRVEHAAAVVGRRVDPRGVFLFGDWVDGAK
jgi:hypothetical protein